jgi:hypothetical protein
MNASHFSQVTKFLYVLFVLTQKVPKKSRANDIQHIRSFALIELCADDSSAVKP